MTLRLIDMFAGIGMFSLAGHDLGRYETVAWIEKETFLADHLTREYPNAQAFQDIQTVEPHELPSADVWCAGFPCQDISIANAGHKGRVGITGDRSRLFAEVVRLAGVCRPACIVFENTPALRFSGLNHILVCLAQIGYDACWQCVSAGQFGAPIYRERLFLVACPAGQRRKAGLQLFTGDAAKIWHEEICRQACREYPIQPPPRGSNGYEVWAPIIAEAGLLANDGAPEVSAAWIKAAGNSVHWLQAAYVLGLVSDYLQQPH